MKVTHKRKYNFADKLLSGITDKIGFIDVGSGGPLKHPWDIIPENRLEKFCIEPTEDVDELPLCISNRSGRAPFHIAHDERGSSLHAPSMEFVSRYDKQSLLTKKTIEVALSTLDEQFVGKYQLIDLIDINTEGHDYQVLEGSESLLQTGFVKLVKVEFELTKVWEGQGWFSDIDRFMRQRNYDLAKMELDYQKPKHVSQIVHSGEPLWGKAYYVPASKVWSDFLQKEQGKERALSAVYKAIVLCTITEIPGRAADVLELAQSSGLITSVQAREINMQIKSTLKFLILGEARRDLIKCIKMPFRIWKYLTI
ncbi:MAG: FkbM family methyltransferase [Candidatus Omnitrophota bacterium]